MNQNPKTEKILDAALDLLRTGGDYGVTMRQVAASTGMSLSNVQYYFKTKDDLLRALADRYFARCLEEIKLIELSQSPESISEDLEILLENFLAHGHEVSEMCRVFREYWAISTRNESIDEYIHQYYRELVSVLSGLLRPAARSEQGLSRVMAILIPYVEGYSITARAMPEDTKTVISILCPLLTALLRDDPAV